MHQREHHLDAGLRRRFLGALAALGPQRLRVDPQRLRDAGAELVGLDQHRDERAEVVDAGAVGEIAQRLGARLAGAQLEVDQPQLVGELGIGERQLGADALQRLVEPEAGFDADHQQVEHVGERQADPVRPALGDPREHHPGQDVAEAEAAEREQDVGLDHEGARRRARTAEREGDADAEEDASAPRRGGSRPAPAAAAGCPSPWASAAPSRRRASARATSPWNLGFSSTSVSRPNVNSSRRRSIATERAGISAYAAATTSAVPNTNASRGSIMTTGYTSILTTCLIQKYPTICMTAAPTSSMCPMRSWKRSCMCSGLMNDSAMHQERRQREQHVAGQPAVRGVDAHLAQDLEALADDVREVLEDLRQVAAGLALDQHGGREEPDVEQRHPHRQVGRARPSAAGRSSARRRSSGTRDRSARAFRRRPSSGRWRRHGRP